MGFFLTILLNAFAISVPKKELTASVIPYTREALAVLRKNYANSHAVRRQGKNILIVSSDGSFPVKGNIESYDLPKNLGLFCFLAKDGIKRHLAGKNANVSGFYPINLVSSKDKDDLLSEVVNQYLPFKILPKYTIDTRIIGNRPYLTIDCSTRKLVSDTCDFFISGGFNIVGRYVVKDHGDGCRKVLGAVTAQNGDLLEIDLLEGECDRVAAKDVYLEASRENFDDYLAHIFGTRKDVIAEKIRISISRFNGGVNKKRKIAELKQYLKKANVSLIDGSNIEISDALNVTSQSRTIDKPVFIFNDNGSANWAEQGFKNFGPYTKRTFDRNDPSICVICGEDDKGRVEQFVRKFLKGIPGHNNFNSGLEGKFCIGTSSVEVFTTATDDIAGYKEAIERAIRKNSENESKWDLALVQVRESFKKLDVRQNPYYLGKSLFFLHQIPVQDFTIELLRQKDYNLGYSLNNMALASYAKMGGVPWLLKSSPTLSHELVVGIGSATIGTGRLSANQRMMGITTVFSGDGSYIVSNTSKAVSPENYCDALSTTLGETIEKLKTRMNWQKGDTIRLIFHASVKKFNKEEIQAVRSVIVRYTDYSVEYAFLKISEDHGLHLFDTESEKKEKGRLAPQRGKCFAISRHEMLIYLIGQRELKQSIDGHPTGIVLNIHRDSTFKDIKYLSSQLFSFASHSWRSYFPSPMPVTISYSDLIARNLGWLNELTNWDDSVMFGKIGQSKWFL